MVVIILVHFILINGTFRVYDYLGMRSLKRILNSIVNSTVTLNLTEGHDENEVWSKIYFRIAVDVTVVVLDKFSSDEESEAYSFCVQFLGRVHVPK